VEYLGQPGAAFVAILRGAKVTEKIAVIENLAKPMRQVDHCRGYGQPLLAAKGYSVQDSLVETGSAEIAKATMAKSGDRAVACRRGRSEGDCY